VKVRFALSAGGDAPDPDELALLAAGADERGFDSLWFSDLPLMAATDPLLAVAFAAAGSPRLRLGVNLVPFGCPPFVVARRLAQLDQLTRGRLLVTLVPGLDQPGERAALGIGAANRGALLDGLIPQLRSWWAGDAVAVGDGTDALALPVRPRQDPLEIWLGGTGPKALRRVGCLADGWLGSLVTPVEAGAIRTRIEQIATDAGRRIDPEHFGLSVPYAHHVDDLDGLRGRRRAGDRDLTGLVPVGAPGLRAFIGQLTDQGLSKFVVRPARVVRSWSAELDWLADAVLDLQT
jgi:probable F420-dependent oxidoreductase